MKDANPNHRQRMPLKDVMASIKEALPGLDAARAQGFSQLGQLRTAKSQSLAREQRLLARKQGPNHPRIATAARRLAVNEQFRRDIAVAREAAETPLPPTHANRFVIHGFVRRRKDQVGIRGLTLALCDAKGQWVRETGYACTDGRGYFAIAIDLSDKPQDNPSAGSTGQKPDPTAASSGTLAPLLVSTEASYASRAEVRASLVLRVFDRAGRTLHTEPSPVRIRAGSMDYRVIYLDDAAADCDCHPPPSEPGGKPAPRDPGVPPTTGSTRPPSSTNPTAPVKPDPRVGRVSSISQPTAEELKMAAGAPPKRPNPDQRPVTSTPNPASKPSHAQGGATVVPLGTAAPPASPATPAKPAKAKAPSPGNAAHPPIPKSSAAKPSTRAPAKRKRS
jgi:hypothetical protein